MKDIDKELLKACCNGNLKKVKQLLEEGADVNVKDEKGRTALMFASWYSHKEVVKQLLEKGADVDAEDIYGKTALMYASEKGHKEIVELLKSYEAIRDIAEKLLNACVIGDLEKVKQLLEKGADVNAREYEYGWTALMLAALNGHKEVVELLIEKGGM